MARRAFRLTVFIGMVATGVVPFAATDAWGQPVTPVPDEQRRQAVDRFRAGMQALGEERFDEAESAFRQAVRLDPLYDAGFYGLGQVYMATRRYEQALRAVLSIRERRSRRQPPPMPSTRSPPTGGSRIKSKR